MTSIEKLAEITVARACGFGGLGIVSVMVGLSFEPSLAVKSGAILLSLMTAVLQYMALRAPHIPYKRTEVWLMIAVDDRPPEGLAQRLIATAMGEAYRRFALFAGIGAAILWVATLIFALAG